MMLVELDSIRERGEVDKIGIALGSESYIERLCIAALLTLQALSETAYDELIERAKGWT